MFRDVRTKRRKKLFEWDKENRLVAVVEKQKRYLCELGDDDEFICIAETDKPPPKQKIQN